jgi:hypothetical protein
MAIPNCVDMYPSRTQTDVHIQIPCTSQLENDAATRIQKVFRGYAERKAFLSRDLYPIYSQLCREKSFDTMPKAKDGKTPVYLPEEIPEVVFKESGRSKAIKRFHKMQSVRAILRSQGSSHLVIPKVRLFGNFLIEERLSIDSCRKLNYPNERYWKDFILRHLTQPLWASNVALYMSKLHLFDHAVREMVRLFSKAYLGDLINSRDFQEKKYLFLNTNIAVRYDNLPLYIVKQNGKKVGKIGLIDLERIRMKPEVLGLADLARIFFCHAKIIEEEATKLKMNQNNRDLTKIFFFPGISEENVSELKTNLTNRLIRVCAHKGGENYNKPKPQIMVAGIVCSKYPTIYRSKSKSGGFPLDLLNSDKDDCIIL